MKRIHVLRQFAWAEDGIHSITYNVGEEPDVSEQCARVATTEGWAEDTTSSADEAGDAGRAGSEGEDGPKEPGAVEIPDDWQTLHHSRLINLAEAVTGRAVKKKAVAVEVIEAELARRARTDGVGGE